MNGARRAGQVLPRLAPGRAREGLVGGWQRDATCPQESHSDRIEPLQAPQLPAGQQRGQHGDGGDQAEGTDEGAVGQERQRRGNPARARGHAQRDVVGQQVD